MAEKNNNQNTDKSSTDSIKAMICVPLTGGDQLPLSRGLTGSWTYPGYSYIFGIPLPPW